VAKAKASAAKVADYAKFAEAPDLATSKKWEQAEGFKVGWRYVWCAQHHFDAEPCDCPPGPQVVALTTPAFEVGLGGGRGGLKSETGRAFLVKGNPGQNSCPADVSYIHHPRYRALVLRKNQTDLADWVERARQFYKPFGADIVSSPTEIRFPSEAIIVVGHMADKDSYEKYQGQEFHRILLEELTQIPDELLYLRIIMSCRSTIPELKPQVFSTFNPGGVGGGWVRKRFVDVKNTKTGQRVPPRTMFKDRKTGLTRIFIFSKVTDNPYLMRDQQYVNTLMALPDAQRRAWLDGDFDALSGQYFTDWRPNGPMVGEEQYPWARHVIPARVLPGYWTRWIALDWGYKHYTVALWFCQDPNGQVHIYRELALNGITPEEFGVELALRSLEDIDGQESRSMSLFYDPSIGAKRHDEVTIVDQIKVGIGRVIGPDAAHILKPGEDQDFFDRQDEQRRAGITLRPAQNQRKAGWLYMHSLMRFKPLLPASADSFDPEYAMKLAREQGAESYFKYTNAFKEQREALPKLLVHDVCKGFIDAIPTLVHDEDGDPEDILKTGLPADDYGDCGRYGLHAHLTHIARKPMAEFVRERLAQINESHHGRLTGSERQWAAAKAEQDWSGAGAQHAAFSIPRIRRSGRVN
jgi:hypothetical protein